MEPSEQLWVGVRRSKRFTIWRPELISQFWFQFLLWQFSARLSVNKLPPDETRVGCDILAIWKDRLSTLVKWQWSMNRRYLILWILIDTINFRWMIQPPTWLCSIWKKMQIVFRHSPKSRQLAFVPSVHVSGFVSDATAVHHNIFETKKRFFEESLIVVILPVPRIFVGILRLSSRCGTDTIS